MQWIQKHLSVDDALSVVGYVGIVLMTRVVNPGTAMAFSSALASGMLAIFWLANKNVRERNRERDPNLRIVFWAAVALGSLLASVVQ